VLSRLLILLTLAAASAGLMSHPAGAAPDTTTTTVVLVRHAEKDTNFVGADQPLNAAGMLRARELSRTLGDVKFSAIYVTPWVRSRKTAEPLAQREGDSLVVIMDAVDGTVRGCSLFHRYMSICACDHDVNGACSCRTLERICGYTIQQPSRIRASRRAT